MGKVREEVRNRVPRLTMSLLIAIIFWIISMVVPSTIGDISIPGVETKASYLVWAITVGITAIFLIRALADALVLGDILTDIFVRRIGIKGERSPRRAARDFIYIIVIILIATAILPVRVFLPDNIVPLFTAAAIYSALAVIIVLIYDIGRVIYRLIEQRAEILADRLSKIAEPDEER
ncbi:MAG: hypothetical protein NWE78_08150 [Candidatus Bathyarchaeota archaeon]|nr:hypothetical protein [Candidatus Bathyarchaeota archaeon]